MLTWGRGAGDEANGGKLMFSGFDINKVIDERIVEHGGAVNNFETLV